MQFSPSSEHILLAYGRRHSSLLKSIDINGNASLSVYTVLEVNNVPYEFVYCIGDDTAKLFSSIITKNYTTL